MPNHPLAEVFGYPVDNFSEEAQRGRAHRLCPFHNKSPNCTKVSVEHPIGVCSVFHGDDVAITCPIRFREDWQIATDAASFFFEPDATWAAVPEVRLNDRDGNSAGNIDLVLVAYDEIGRVVDYGAVISLVQHAVESQQDDRRSWRDLQVSRLLAPFLREGRLTTGHFAMGREAAR